MLPPVHEWSTTLPPVKYVRPVSPPSPSLFSVRQRIASTWNPWMRPLCALPGSLSQTSNCTSSVPPCGFTRAVMPGGKGTPTTRRSEEHTSELQSRLHLVCRLLLEKKKKSCYSD